MFFLHLQPRYSISKRSVILNVWAPELYAKIFPSKWEIFAQNEDFLLLDTPPILQQWGEAKESGEEKSLSINRATLRLEDGTLTNSTILRNRGAYVLQSQ